jgi:hypothetical protein
MNFDYGRFVNDSVLLHPYILMDNETYTFTLFIESWLRLSANVVVYKVELKNSFLEENNGLAWDV